MDIQLYNSYTFPLTFRVINGILSNSDRQVTVKDNRFS